MKFGFLGVDSLITPVVLDLVHPKITWEKRYGATGLDHAVQRDFGSNDFKTTYKTYNWNLFELINSFELLSKSLL